ncbi:MAG: hypothetical protein RMJ35_09795, partial [Phycisphaerales bacterium]|nr:hypothetical protein [Phycisphaerales bacterium]
SKEETLRILQRRMELLARRAQTIAEIEADLVRIEAEVDLALENATLGPQATCVTGSVKLATTMLESDLFGASQRDVDALDASYRSAAAEQ